MERREEGRNHEIIAWSLAPWSVAKGPNPPQGSCIFDRSLQYYRVVVTEGARREEVREEKKKTQKTEREI